MLQKTGRFFNSAAFYWLAGLILLLCLGDNPLWGSEDRWAEISRSMLLSGDWVHPAINGTVYFDKPLLSYWPIALLGWITGMMNEFIVRLPSALAALLALWATRDLARRVTNNERIVLFSGWLLLSSLGFIFWGRSAAADMLNLAVVVLAVDVFYRAQDNARFHDYLLFYVICFAGALAKGLPAVILPPAVVLVKVLFDGSWKKHCCWQNFAALPFGIALGLFPFLLAAKLPMPDYYLLPDHGLNALELVWRENVLRVFQPFDHNDEPWCSYFWHMPRIMAPWAVVMLGALLAGIVDWKKLSANRRWLWRACGIIFLLFTLSGSRRWYYILPIMPFFTIQMAAYLTEVGRWSEILRKLHWYVFTILGFAALFGTIAVLFFLRWTGYMEIFLALQGAAVTASILIAAAAIVIILHKNRNWGAIIASGVIGMAAAFDAIFPATGQLRTEKPFAIQLGNLLQKVPESQIFFYEREAPKVTFYMGTQRPIMLLKGPKDLQKMLKAHEGETVYLIVESREKTLQSLLETLPILSLQEPILIESRIARFEKPNARKLICWKYVIPKFF